jgi:hypothetical protein
MRRIRCWGIATRAQVFWANEKGGFGRPLVLRRGLLGALIQTDRERNRSGEQRGKGKEP